MVGQGGLHQCRPGLPAGTRFFVQRGGLRRVRRGSSAAAESLDIGDPQGPATEIGPLASEEHWKKVHRLSRRHCRGAAPSALPAVRGRLVRAADCGGGGRPRGRISGRRCSAPLVVVHPFDSESEAVRLANDTPYGLNAMVFTQDLSQGPPAGGALRAGTVWVNCFFIRDLRDPFGGVGDSGVGREGGDFSREFFTEPKAVVMAVAPSSEG